MQGDDVRGRQDRGKRLGLFVIVRAPDDPGLVGPRRIADLEANQKTVQLGLGQGKRAVVFDGILGGDDHEGGRQGVGLAVHGDPQVAHGFQEGALGLGRRPVDLVGQDDLVEDGAAPEFEAPGLRIEDGQSQDVRREEVVGELDALERGVDGAGQGDPQKRFADAGHVLDQKMAAGQEGRGRQPDGRFFADEYAADIGDQAVRGMASGRGRRGDWTWHGPMIIGQIGVLGKRKRPPGCA